VSATWVPNPAARQKVRQAAEQAVKDAAEQVKKSAQGNTPVLTGALRDSAQVDAEGLDARIVYTDPKAVLIHEDMYPHHDVGSAKFLETAMHTDTEQALMAMAQELRKAFGG